MKRSEVLDYVRAPDDEQFEGEEAHGGNLGRFLERAVPEARKRREEREAALGERRW